MFDPMILICRHCGERWVKSLRVKRPGSGQVAGLTYGHQIARAILAANEEARK